ncbi:MAG TPA: cob(I)yrinic acid a,c-diamide adenosyltransferase, partial [Steroidobacter sp.]
MSTPTDGLSEAEKDRLHAEEMKLRQAERRAERATKKERGGLLMILTGPGKGKSSSAFGMVARALGWDMRIGIVQFIKGKWQTGEKHFFRRFPELVTFEVMGEGFTWDVQDRQRDITAAQKAWQRSCELIVDPDYDFVLLDELNIALAHRYVALDEVIAAVTARPPRQQVVVTGRGAPDALVE